MHMISLSLLLVSQISVTHAAETKSRPECVEWNKGLSQSVDDPYNSSEWHLRSGRTLRDLIAHIRKYPSESGIRVESIPKKMTTDQLSRWLNEPSCFPIAYFDAVKNAIKLAGNDKNSLKEIRDELFDRTLKEEGGTLIPMITRVALVKQLIEKDAIEMSDATYFEFGSIENDLQKEKARIRSNQPEDLWNCEGNPLTCPKKYLEKISTVLHEEVILTRSTRDRLAWWMKRIKR